MGEGSEGKIHTYIVVLYTRARTKNAERVLSLPASKSLASTSEINETTSEVNETTSEVNETTSEVNPTTSEINQMISLQVQTTLAR